MAALVDSNVLIDLATLDPVWFKWSRRIVETTKGKEALVINPIIFSEFSVRYQSYDEVDVLLDTEEFRREDLPYMAAFAASKAFVAYRKAGGTKEKPLPDFFIGAHAVVRGYRIITRDPSGYRSYFPGVELITPDTYPMGKLLS